MKSPRTDSERDFVESIILYAMNERVVLTDVGRAVDNAYTTYMRAVSYTHLTLPTTLSV